MLMPRRGFMRWHGKAARQRIEKAMEIRMRTIGERVASHARRKMSAATRAFGPSRPGDKYPHADTGKLRKSVSWNVERRGGKVKAMVGISAQADEARQYAKFVHEGTRRMEGRPYLQSAIEENRDKIRKILSEPLNL